MGTGVQACGGVRGVRQMLTIADEGGKVREKINKMGQKVPKMCVKEANCANLGS